MEKKKVTLEETMEILFGKKIFEKQDKCIWIYETGDLTNENIRDFHKKLGEMLASCKKFDVRRDYESHEINLWAYGEETQEEYDKRIDDAKERAQKFLDEQEETQSKEEERKTNKEYKQYKALERKLKKNKLI